MKIFSKPLFEMAQRVARDAVKHGSEQSYDLDWMAAMNMLKMSVGMGSVADFEKQIELVGKYDSQDG